MELPELGKQCNLTTCRQLDFLPYKCADCKLSFCQEHYQADSHQCQNKQSTRPDIRVPTCNRCHKPVPFRHRDQSPQQRLADHIASNCQDIITTHQICTAAHCKTKILVPIQCSSCKRVVCVKHRWPKEHNCQSQPRIPSKTSDTRKIQQAYRATDVAY
ncbi:zinc finger, AN1-type domain [Umbelopsis sp. WA50703]